MTTISNLSTSTPGAPATASAAIGAIEAQPPQAMRPKGAIEYVTDSEGRRIGAKKLGAIDVFELSMLLGDHASNQAVLSQSLMAASVAEIDGEHIARPQTLLQLRALITRLDFAGYAAASEAVAKLSPAAAPVSAIKN